MMPPAGDEMPYVSPPYEQVWGRSCESLYQNPMAWLDAIEPAMTAEEGRCRLFTEADPGGGAATRNTAYEPRMA